MRTMENECKNIFRDKRISNERVDGAFGEFIDNINEANDSGQFDDILGPLNDKYNPFHIKYGKVGQDIAQGKGLRFTREEVMGKFKFVFRSNIGSIKLKYVDDVPAFLEIYPNGLMPVNRWNKNSALTIMENYAAAIYVHRADFAAPFLASVDAFPGQYTSAKTNQNTKKETTGSDRSGRSTDRVDLEDVMFDAYNYIKFYCRGNVAFMKAIFPMERLYSHPRTEIEHFKSEIVKNTTVNPYTQNWTTSYVAVVKNTGKTVLYACISLLGATACANVFEIMPGRTRTIRIEIMGPLNYSHFNITNPDANRNGSFDLGIYTD